MHPPRS